MTAIAPTQQSDAYRHCEAVTRREARNFYYGIRLLPPARREAVCSIYALARRIDDVADGSLPAPAKLTQLASIREALECLDAHTDDPVLVAVWLSAQRYPLPLEAFFDLIAGAQMDVLGTRYEQFDDVAEYCRRVAGSVGRLVTGALECSAESAPDRADELGVAMQLTNILRDIGEDLAVGRVYLPQEDLRRFSCILGADHDQFRELVRFEAARAHAWFDRGLELLPMLDRSGAAFVGALAGIYERLLRRVEEHPDAVMERRLGVPAWEKGWVALRSLAGAAAP